VYLTPSSDQLPVEVPYATRISLQPVLQLVLLMPNNLLFDNYPHLTTEEFAEICHYFDSAYHRAELGAIRKTWQLNLITHTDSVPFSSELISSTYIRIRRNLDQETAASEISADLRRLKLASQADNTDDDEMMHDTDMPGIEEADDVSSKIQPLLHCSSPFPDSPGGCCRETRVATGCSCCDI
jgi:hypothetical protein